MAFFLGALAFVIFARVGGNPNTVRDRHKYCCCDYGSTWNHLSKQCESVNIGGLTNGGQLCHDQCKQREGVCPQFCGKGGKCCRSGWNEPSKDLTGNWSCGEYEGPPNKHVCVGSAHVAGIAHEGAKCWDKCDKRSGKCNYCGAQGFCCRINSNDDRDLRGPAACLPHEGGISDHICVNKGKSYDVMEVIEESKNWPKYLVWCNAANQVECDKKSEYNSCCCDPGYHYDKVSGACLECPAGATNEECEGSVVINDTSVERYCHPSEHKHECVTPVAVGAWGWFLQLIGCIFLCVCGCCLCAPLIKFIMSVWLGMADEDRDAQSME